MTVPLMNVPAAITALQHLRPADAPRAHQTRHAVAGTVLLLSATKATTKAVLRARHARRAARHQVPGQRQNPHAVNPPAVATAAAVLGPRPHVAIHKKSRRTWDFYLAIYLVPVVKPRDDKFF